jgi:hypothetical protein
MVLDEMEVEIESEGDGRLRVGLTGRNNAWIRLSKAFSVMKNDLSH